MSYDFGSRRLVSQEDSASIENAQIPRTRITGSWSHKTTFDAGWLIPFMVEEILPGDHMQFNVTAYVRMSTPLFPIFDNQRVDTFFFYVPNRLTWPNWVKLMGEQDEPDDSIAFTVPYIESEVGGYALGTIYDHMELPAADMQVTGSFRHSALPLRAYYQIWNAWFRDQNVQNSVLKQTDDGPDLYSEYGLLKRAKSHDYFTSALPWPQKFQAATVPLLGLVPISGIGSNVATASTGPFANVRETGGNIQTWPFYKNANTGDQYIEYSAATGAFPMVYGDLSAATGMDINQLRQAFLVQQLVERDARGGTRYVELIRSHFGVVNPDFRLQRPEYIGGGQTPLIITPIAQTAPDFTAEGSVVGALGATGTAAGQHRASYAATEHGYIIGLINVRSELSYQQGLARHWSRSTRYDFYWPALAGLGEQAILRQEIYCTGVPANDVQVFGYQERWQEYRTRQSAVTGYFRSNISGTLDMWHLAQYFGSAPTLNGSFLSDSPPMERILAAAEEAQDQQYLADIFIQRTMARPITTYGTPVTLGRF